MFQPEQSPSIDQDVVTSTMRSAVVCLHFLLKAKKNHINKEIFEKKLFNKFNPELSSSRSITDQNIEQNIELPDVSKLHDNLIIDNLPEILFEDQFDEFRTDLINILKQHGDQEETDCFLERLEMAKNLPQESKNHVRGIVAELKHNTDNFFDWLFNNCIRFENLITRNALLELVFSYLPTAMEPSSTSTSITPISSSVDLDTIYTDNSSNISACRDLGWELFIDSSQQQQPMEFINRRIECWQALKSGVISKEDPNLIWKFKEQDPPMPIQDLNDMVVFSSKFPGNTCHDKLSCALNQQNSSFVANFKHKLEKVSYKI